MKTCPHCRIQVGGDGLYCPLCHTPLAGAAFKGNLAMVRLLLEHGADVEGASPDGKTALMMAAMFNRTEIVEYLIGQGADPHARAGNGATPLEAAAMMGAADTQALLSRLVPTQG